MKWKSIFALLTCTCFLIGNIVYDRIDTPENPADYRIFYIPFSFMIFSLILLGFSASKGYGKVIFEAWRLFLWLSVGQISKFCLFDPFVPTINDYVYLAVIFIYVIFQFVKKKK